MSQQQLPILLKLPREYPAEYGTAVAHAFQQTGQSVVTTAVGQSQQTARTSEVELFEEMLADSSSDLCEDAELRQVRML